MSKCNQTLNDLTIFHTGSSIFLWYWLQYFRRFFSVNDCIYLEYIFDFRTNDSIFPNVSLCWKWLLNVLFMKILHHILLYSKSILVILHINMVCAVKRRYVANHIAYKCVCKVINGNANMLQIDNGTKMGFCTVHYLDCLLRTESWKYSVCALMTMYCTGNNHCLLYLLRPQMNCWEAERQCWSLLCNITWCSFSYCWTFTEEFIRLNNESSALQSQ